MTNQPINPTLPEYISALGKNQAINLHLGCGGVKWKDYINIDLHPDTQVPDSSRNGCVADFFADIRNLGLPDNSVDAIFSSHVLEHFTKWEAQDMLKDWHRMLKPGALLDIEMPDFWRCVIWLFHPKKKKRILARNQFYGNQTDRLNYETHRYVWAGKEFANELAKIGYKNIKISHKPQTHKKGRDMRVVAYK